MMKHILITGGAGFIGSNTVQHALNQDLKVTVLDSFESSAVSAESLEKAGANVLKLDIRDERSIRNINEEYDAIIHLAAQVSVPKSIQDPEYNHSVNINGSEHVLEFGRRNNVKRFIFASSSAVYGDCETMPLSENSEGELQSPYAQSKLEMEKVIDAQFKQGAECLSLRFFNVYGPNQKFDSSYGAVIPIFINLLSQGIQPTIYGSGKQSRDFVHVRDVARLLVDVAVGEWNNRTQSVYNVGTGTSVSVNELASLIHKLTDSTTKLEPKFEPERRGDIQHSLASIAAVSNDLNWKPEISLQEGLEELIEVKSR
tara:strand:+ start:1091 stop:2032 length:942 start_codon:yes stop_codon:yes gene_type:complete